MEIAVVDDEPQMRRMLERALSRMDFSVVSCADGNEALRLLDEREGGLLLVLDYAMPEINGAEVCKKIRAHPDPAIAQTPIILLTAHSGEENEIECFEAGADDFVSKPVSLPVLKARIDTHSRLAIMRAQLREQNRELEEWRAVREFDMEAAGLIQRAIIPRQLPELKGWQFALHSRPLIQVGGDSFDAVSLKEGGVLIWIADATGHGVSAALVTVLLKLIYSHAAEEAQEPAEVIERVNREFMVIFKGHSFLTTACVKISPEQGKLRAAGAGHPPVIIVRGDGALETLPSSVPPVGLMVDGEMVEWQAELKPGDAALLITDGVYGVSNPAGKRLSFAQLLQTLEGVQAETAEALIQSVISRSKGFAQGGPFDDDVALVAMRREGMGGMR